MLPKNIAITRVNSGLLDRPVRALKRLLARKVAELVDFHAKTQELSRIAAQIEAQSLGDRLNDDQLAALTRGQDTTMLVEQRRKYFREADHSRTFHGIVVPRLEYLLDADPSIASVANIGCSYAYFDHRMATKYTTRQFFSVDVNPGLADINADLSAPNLSFMSGYALDMLEQGELAVDLVYMSSTATVIRNPELRRYLRALARRAKYVVVSEPVWLLPGGEVRAPRSTGPNTSLPAYVQRRPVTDEYVYICYNHDYGGLMEEAGFQVIEERFFRPEYTYLYWTVVIGQNLDGTLWA